MKMSLTVTACALAAGLSAPAFAEATTYEIDPAHTTAQFSVRHMMVSTVRGEFGKVTGTVRGEMPGYKNAAVEVSIDASSVNTRDPKRDGHLKSPDFFDVAKFPNITFKSTKVEAQKSGGFKVAGDLTIRGVTKPVVLDVAAISPEVKGLDGQMHVGTVATTKVNRKDFGLVWNKALEGGGVLVGDEVSLSIDVELVKKGAAPHASR